MNRTITAASVSPLILIDEVAGAFGGSARLGLCGATSTEVIFR
ncbi:MAG: hypothetical protein ABI305_14180 [Tepidiformaceae bacterium]